MAGCLYSTGFMNMDVSTVSAQHPLMGPQGRINYGEVGLCTANQKMDISILTAA